jgi:opacity protein-like surface antigen
MRRIVIATMIGVVTAVPSFAQTERGYVTGGGGIAVSTGATSGDVLFEGGVRIAPHLLVFGDVGQFHNLQPSDVQPAVNNATILSASQGLDLAAAGRVPAVYSVGGLRYEIPLQSRFAPYVLGGAGFARLSPGAQFTVVSATGTLPDGTTPAVGANVTTQLMSGGDFSPPPASTAFMFTLGGGVDMPVMPHWAIDIGYRFSRVSAATPLNTQGATVGFGYRF